MNRRNLLMLASGLPLVGGCFYDRYFDIAWDEEVKLHDGRVITVHIKRKYERRRKSVLPYDADSIQFRGGELEFSPSLSQRVVVRTRQPMGCLDQFGADWFLVLSGQGPFGASDESPSRWGRDFTTNEQRLAKLVNGEFLPVRWEEAPPNLVNLNLTTNAFYSEFSQWNGKKLTLEMKEKFRTRHHFPTAAQITRPNRMNSSGRSK